MVIALGTIGTATEVGLVMADITVMEITTEITMALEDTIVAITDTIITGEIAIMEDKVTQLEIQIIAKPIDEV